MAGDWLKIEHTTPDKPEVIMMAARLKTDSDSIVGKLLRIWIWADQNTIDGNAVAVTSAFLDRLTGRKGFASAMRACGWLTGEDGALSFPGFSRHNGRSAKARADTNRRVSKHRRGNASVTDEALQKPLPEKRREEKSIVSNQNGEAYSIPQLADVKAYAHSSPIPISEECAIAFHDTQEAEGWLTRNGHRIADWRAALRRYASIWNQNQQSRTNGMNPSHRTEKKLSEYPETRTPLPRL